MSYTFADLLATAKALPPVPLTAATSYKTQQKAMTGCVDAALREQLEINQLIGYNPLQIMFDNHRHHAAFMATVFTIGDYELLAKTIPWVYRAYHAHNFSYDYFPIELTAWRKALRQHMASNLIAEIDAVYVWMLEQHEQMIHLAQTTADTVPPLNMEMLEIKEPFQEQLLAGNAAECLRLAESASNCKENLEQFYQLVMQPTMYEVGMLWEKNQISVAREHLASAIVTSLLAKIYPGDYPVSLSGGRILISTAPNEHHSIGARMLNDLLVLDGWETCYLGQDTPIFALLEMVREFKPHILALSVTMPFNIDQAKEVVTEIKTASETKQIKVLVGGRILNENPRLWKTTGADAFAATPAEAKKIARKFYPHGAA